MAAFSVGGGVWGLAGVDGGGMSPGGDIGGGEFVSPISASAGRLLGLLTKVRNDAGSLLNLSRTEDGSSENISSAFMSMFIDSW